MRTYVFVIVLLMIVGGVFANSYLSGYLRNYSGVLLSENDTYMQNSFNLSFEHSKDMVALKVNPYLYHYPNQDLQIGLREAFVDIYFNSVDLRIGKQQIIWGKADGVFITDIVSPKDLSEFLLRDFDEIRQGITAIKADYYLGNHNFELVYAPTFTPTKMPTIGSIWRPTMETPVVPSFDNSNSQIEQNLENGEIFVKYSAMTSAIDLEIMGGYMWDDDPSNHRGLTIDHETLEVIDMTITPQHHRLGLVGGSFSSTLGAFVVRGESAFYEGKYFASETGTDGLSKKNYLHYLLGVDYSLWDIRISTQFVQQYILDYETSLTNDEFDNTLTLLLKRDLLRETLSLELFSYVGLNNSDALIRPSVKYLLTDGFDLIAGANIFVGDKGRFGQFEKNDMVYTKVKYSF